MNSALFLVPSTVFKSYAAGGALGADVDLVADYQAKYTSGNPNSLPAGKPCRAIYVGAAGDLGVVDGTGATVVIAALPAGSFLNGISAVKLVAASTTAQKITVFW